MTTSDRTFLLPDLGEGLTEAEIVRWIVTVGDDVSVDEPIVEVETAKSIVEVPSPYAGRVLTCHAAAGESLAVGKPLVTIATAGTPAGASVPAADVPAEPTAEAEKYRAEEQAGSGNVLIGYGTGDDSPRARRRRPRRQLGQPSVDTPAVEPPAGSVPAGTPAPTSPMECLKVPRVVSPLVRRLAAECGVDLRGLTGTGRGGLIIRRDVESAATQAPSPPAADLPRSERPDGDQGAGRAGGVVTALPGETRIPLSGFRKAVSAALVRSRSEIPEATVWVDVDVTTLWDLRELTRSSQDAGPGILAYLARFTVAALQQFPVLNSRVDTEHEEIVQLDQVNLGLAVQSQRGLVVPAVMGADRLTTTQLDLEIRRITTAAREGRSTQQELTAGTFTLNNYGTLRVDGSAAIINHPQVAILGFGRMIERPWVVNGAIVPRRLTQMSFVFDHRVCDGGTAAGFMRLIADAIEDPASAIANL